MTRGSPVPPAPPVFWLVSYYTSSAVCALESSNHSKRAQRAAQSDALPHGPARSVDGVGAAATGAQKQALGKAVTSTLGHGCKRHRGTASERGGQGQIASITASGLIFKDKLIVMALLILVRVSPCMCPTSSSPSSSASRRTSSRTRRRRPRVLAPSAP